MKKQSRVVLFFKTKVSRQQNNCKISAKVHSKFNLNRSKLLKSEQFLSYKIQADQRHQRQARVPDPTQCIRVQYCFNFLSGGNRDLESTKSLYQTGLIYYNAIDTDFHFNEIIIY